jgi:hypothetical protein
MPNYRLKKGSVQWGFSKSRSPIQIFGGGYGNGKTTAMVIKALQLAKFYPGSNGLLARATYPKLNDTLRKEFFRWCPKNWIKKMPTSEDNTCYLHNGTVINFRYIAQKGKKTESGDTSSNLLSATYDWIGVDQVEDPEISHKDVLDLMGRLRGQTPYRADEGEEDPTMPSTGPRFMMLSANPNMNWFYREIIKPYLIWKMTGRVTEKLLINSETGIPIIDLYESDTYANKDNLPSDFISNLETMYKGQQRKRFLEGKYATFEGLVHGDYSDTNKLTRDQAIEYVMQCLKRHVKLQVLEGYDFGLVKPTCYMLGVVDDYGRVIILDGFYEPNFHYTLHAEKIFEIRQGYAGYGFKFNDSIRADPAIFKKIVVAGRKDTGDTIAKLLGDDGLHMRPASNDVVAGIAKINAYINGRADIKHLITGELNSPLLYVIEDLEFFEDEVTSYYWKKNPLGNLIDEPQDENDHAMNTLKYMLAHLPHPSKIEVPKSHIKPPWMFWQEEPDTPQYA